jgi:hypothetical protein
MFISTHFLILLNLCICQDYFYAFYLKTVVDLANLIDE